jgi:hypothetical protein
MANGPQQQGSRQIGEVLTDDNGDSFTWTLLPDGTEGWKLTALLQAGGGSAVESSQDAVADEEGGGVPGWMRTTAGILRDLGRSGAQGATAGFSDELRGFGAAITPGGMDYTEARDAEREALADIPAYLRVPGEIAGGLLSGGTMVRAATSLPRAGAAIARGMRGQGSILPKVLGVKRGEQAARALATGAVGATEGALYGAGVAEGGLEDRLRGLGHGLWQGGAAGGFLPFIPGIGRITAPLSGAGPRTLRTGEAIQEGLERAVPPGIAVQPTPIPMRPTLPDPAAMTRTGAASPVSRRVVGEGRGQTGGLLQALQDRGAEQARVLREGVQEVRDKFYKPLDAKFQRGWDTEIVGDLSRDAREANVELVRLLRDDVLGNADLGSALRGRPLTNTPHVDPDVIRDLGNVIKSSGRGGEDYAELVEMLGHEEISMLRRNLRSLADNRVPDARIAMDKVDDLMETMFGPGVTRANREFAKASQLQNVGMAGRGKGVKALTTDSNYVPLFEQKELLKAGGMREAVAALPEVLGRELDPTHVAAAERQLKMGRWHQAMSEPSSDKLHKFLRTGEGRAWVEELFKDQTRIRAEAGFKGYTPEARAGLDNALLAIRNNAPNLLDAIARQLYRHAGWLVAAAALAPVASGLLGGNDNR